MVKTKSDITQERTTFKPFKYPWAYDAWLQHEQSHWLHTEVPMSEDVKDYKKLNKDEQEFLTKILRFFVQGDLDIGSGYYDHYLPVFKQPEVRMMLGGFAGREALHIAAYSHLIESLGMPESTYNEFMLYKEMADKHLFLDQFTGDDPSQKAEQLAVFSAFTEGLQLFSTFVMLLNFPRKGKMKGMGQIVTWSIVDESMHVEGMIQLFRTHIEENRHVWNDDLKRKLYDIAERMVELEDNFIDLAFGLNHMEDLKPESVKKYIRYIADRRLISMGLKGIFKVKRNPLPWVDEMVNAPVHGNFFESRVTDYAKGAMQGDWNNVFPQ